MCCIMNALALGTGLLLSKCFDPSSFFIIFREMQIR